MTSEDVKISKLLSYALRHDPAHIGISLDARGYVAVAELLKGLARRGVRLSRSDLAGIVERSDKQRFALTPDGHRIRANQGHSVEVELGYEPQLPPPVLYHGTAEHRVAAIRERGLLRGERHHVHLSRTPATARSVGARHGRAVVLEIDAARMHADGTLFYLSENGVWLTDQVPPVYLKWP